MAERNDGVIDRDRLIRLLGWISAHPSIADLDEVSELAIAGLRSCSAAEDSVPVDAGEREAIERVVGLLDELLDTVGNCETEERNLKSRLWLNAAASAHGARDLLQSNR